MQANPQIVIGSKGQPFYFPPDATPEEMQAFIDEHDPIQPQNKAPEKAGFGQRLGELAQDPRALFDQTWQGMVPFADEAASLATSGVLKGYDKLKGLVGAEQDFAGQSIGDIYLEAQKIQNDRLASEQEKYGAATLVPNVVGGILTAPILGVIGKSAPAQKVGEYAGKAVGSLGAGRIGQAIAKGTIAGGALGGLYGAGQGEGADRLASAAQGTAIGGALGGALAGAVPLIGNAYQGIKGAVTGTTKAFGEAKATINSIDSTLKTLSQRLAQAPDDVQIKSVIDNLKLQKDEIVNSIRAQGSLSEAQLADIQGITNAPQEPLSASQKWLQENIPQKDATRAIREYSVIKGRTGVETPLAGLLPENQPIKQLAKIYPHQPETAAISQAGISKFADDINVAKEKWIAGLSDGTASKYDAADFFRSATGDIQESIMQQAKNEVRPQYQQVFKQDGSHKLVNDKYLNELAKNDKYQAISEAVASNPLYENLPKNSVEFLDAIQSRVGKLARRATDSVDSSGLDILGNKINKAISGSLDDSSNKLLAQTRARYSDGITDEKILSSSPLGRVIKASQFDGMQGVKQVMTANAPTASYMKKQFLNAGKEKEWMAASRAFVEDAFDSVSENSSKANLRDLLFKDKNQQATMVAVLGKQHASGLKYVVNVVDKLKQIKSNIGGSLTQSNQEIRNASNIIHQNMLGKTLNVIKAPMQVIGTLKNSVSSPQGAIELANNLTFSKESMQELARYLYTPEGIGELKRIAAAKTPQAKQAIATQILQRVSTQSNTINEVK